MKRALDGVLIVDKPPGISSAGVVARVKKLLEAKKVGHTGTLDPFAEGLMILCLGKATRLARFFLHGEKTYEALLYLGIETDTQDSTGDTVATGDIGRLTEQEVFGAFEKFEGTVEQVPPVFSALKHKGRPLYRLARQGTPVRKPPRTVHFYRLEILTVDLPEVRFRVTCSAGAYIRTLAADIGKRLRCGGHLKKLRRTRSSGFDIERAVSLEELGRIAEAARAGKNSLDHLLIPMAGALEHLPEYEAGDELAKRIANGVILEKQDVESMGEPSAPLSKIRGHSGDEDDEFFKVVNSVGALVAVVRRDKRPGKYEYCCVFPV
jgi:tRNA pseudouridine55 synthase